METDNFINNNFINKKNINHKYLFKLNMKKGLMDSRKITSYRCYIS